MQAKLADVMQALADEKQRRESIEQQKSIDVYKAVTDRLESLKEISPDAMRVVVSQVVQQAMSDHIKQLESAIRQGDAVPPAPSAPPPPPPSPDPQQPQEIAQ
jgi:anthranilate/para-aminobenzoate synthase component I